MPKGVLYDDESKARDYAAEINGVVEASGDGNYVVIEMDEEGFFDKKPSGCMGGGMAHEKRDPIKYAKGGAVKGKGFKGNY